MKDELDPKGLIQEAYRIEGISAPECRSIFLDWALGVPLGADPRETVRALLARHAGEPADHPMTLPRLMASKDSAAAQRVTQAMLAMSKLDAAALEAAAMGD